MKTLILGMALAAIPATVQAQRVTLRSDHALCSTIAVASRLEEARGTFSAWAALLKAEVEQKRCRIIPAATNVWAQTRSGAFTCVKDDDMPQCAWTVLDALD